MLNINDILYKYILEKYGSISAFSDYSGIPQIELNAILLKENISLDIRSGLILCKKLNIDIEKLLFLNEIVECQSFVTGVKDAEKSNRKNKDDKSYKNDKKDKFGKSGEMLSLNTDINGSEADSVSENELRDRYMRLSEIEKKEVLEYVDEICEMHDNI